MRAVIVLNILTWLPTVRGIFLFRHDRGGSDHKPVIFPALSKFTATVAFLPAHPGCGQALTRLIITPKPRLLYFLLKSSFCCWLGGLYGNIWCLSAVSPPLLLLFLFLCKCVLLWYLHLDKTAQSSESFWLQSEASFTPRKTRPQTLKQFLAAHPKRSSSPNPGLIWLHPISVIQLSHLNSKNILKRKLFSTWRQFQRSVGIYQACFVSILRGMNVPSVIPCSSSNQPWTHVS